MTPHPRWDEVTVFCVCLVILNAQAFVLGWLCGERWGWLRRRDNG